MNNDAVILIYTTFETLDQARKTGRQLVEERLAACVNILPHMVSIYEWEGDRNEADEVVMIVKTRASHLESAQSRLKELHPYETPAIIALNPIAVDADFQAWIKQQTQD